MKNKPIRFIVISGGGWLIDLATMTLLVWLGLEPIIANLCSATLAVTFVYWISRLIVFDKKIEQKAFTGYLAYYVYSLIVIAVFSLLIQYLSYLLHGIANGGITFTISAFIAKVVITPLNLFINFVVSKYIVGKT
ncbi:GtrA family protein [Kosakonia sacchari]|uniref:GtrA family protein n=1 Tax=Kosakonia TaxID=1330547 RepID=UPI00190AD77F|nr:GtrA family protein [Kosakonia sp. LAM2021]